MITRSLVEPDSVRSAQHFRDVTKRRLSIIGTEATDGQSCPLYSPKRLDIVSSSDECTVSPNTSGNSGQSALNLSLGPKPLPIETSQPNQMFLKFFSPTYQIQCSSLRKNGFVMIKARPCRVLEICTSLSHLVSFCSYLLIGNDIFSGEQIEAQIQESQYIDVPNIIYCDLQLTGISDDGFVTLMNEKGDTRDDLRVPDGEMGTKIREEYGKEDNTVIVTVMSAVGEEAIIACKNATS
ncbi:eukaryotic translation initiation factor 5A-like [Oppia nitens]|uniref:eukaryotic translation initiation factor 5A-like n=1 Tax=Oppia nitens TaxID=1686743 RepID=UPI0023DA5B4A|nr:eukaryotic translation initiation factor 5A-like [Oppia nitens]